MEKFYEECACCGKLMEFGNEEELLKLYASSETGEAFCEGCREYDKEESDE